MSAAIRKALPDVTVELVAGGRGDFTVTADGRPLWDKHETGDFPHEADIVKMLSESARSAGRR